MLLRLISFPIHGVVELTAGLALMAAPLALGFGTEAMILAVVLGAAMVGLGFATTGTGADERGTLSVGAHAGCDRALALLLLGTAIGAGAAGEVAALALFAAVALLQIGLNVTTRYTVART